MTAVTFVDIFGAAIVRLDDDVEDDFDDEDEFDDNDEDDEDEEDDEQDEDEPETWQVAVSR